MFLFVCLRVYPYYTWFVVFLFLLICFVQAYVLKVDGSVLQRQCNNIHFIVFCVIFRVFVSVLFVSGRSCLKCFAFSSKRTIKTCA